MEKTIECRKGRIDMDGVYISENEWIKKRRGKTRLKQNTRMPWKSKCEDPAIFTHPQSYPFTAAV